MDRIAAHRVSAFLSDHCSESEYSAGILGIPDPSVFRLASDSAHYSGIHRTYSLPSAVDPCVPGNSGHAAGSEFTGV